MYISEVRKWAFEILLGNSSAPSCSEGLRELLSLADELTAFALNGLPATDLSPEQKLAKVKELVETN